MESKAKLAGHPVHPMLIVFPLGLLITAVAFDIAYFASDRLPFATVSFWNIIVGVCLGLVAAVFGLMDWFAIPRNTRAKTIGAWHGLGNVVVVALFFLSWLLRLADDARAPSVIAFALGIIGLAGAAVTGWLGGELVDRLGVGVDPGANVDAPSSLSGKPADARRLEPQTQTISR